MARALLSLATVLALGAATPAVAESGAELLRRVDELYARSDFAGVQELLAATPLDRLPPGERARILERLAFAQIELSRYREALATAERAKVDAHAAGDLRALTNLELAGGAVARNQGRALEAIAHYESALELAERLGAPDRIAWVLTSLASAHQLLGDWSRFIDYNERALAANPNPLPLSRLQSLIQRGIGFYELADRDRAYATFEEALALGEELGDLRSQSLATGELGIVTWNYDRDAAGALAAYDRAIALARQSGVAALEASWLLNSGNVLRDTGDANGALERYRAGLALARSSRLERESTILRKNMGQVLSGLGRTDEAEPLLLGSLEDADRLRIPSIQWQARMELGELYRERDPERARGFYEASLDQLEASHAGVLLEQLQTRLVGRALAQYDPYERFVDFLMSRGEAPAAFAVAERGRARIFLEQLATVRSAVAPEVPAGYLEEERTILARITAEQAALREPDLGAAERRRHIAAIERDEGALTLLRARLSREQPALAHVRYPHLPGWEELRREVLSGDEALVVYFLGRRRSWAWVATREESAFAELAARDEIAELVAAYRDELARPAASLDRRAGEALWRAVVAPLAKSLPAEAHLMVVPHGALQYLPFEALPLPDGRFLVEAHTVSYAPPASSLAHLRRHAAEPAALRRVLAIGNPVVAAETAAIRREGPLANVGLLGALPHSGEELRRVAGVFGDAVSLLEAEAATEQALAAAPLAEVGILHFATHALVDELRPERSGLALTAAPPADGLLQVREIYGLRLGALLVTLSACETALGREVAGEGLVGLVRAFFHAGAGAVAATLWSVEDAAAAELMHRFYRGLAAGRPLHRALAEAKRSFVDDGGRTAHPYYWAPYVVSGHGGVRLRRPPAARPGVWWAGAAALAAASALVLRAARRRRRTAATPTR